MASESTIKGAKQLFDFLNQLPLNVEKNIMRSALRAGAAVIAKEAKTLAPVKMGGLKASIRTGSNAKKGGAEAYVRAGGRKNKAKSKDNSAFYAQFVEFGTAAHMIYPSTQKKLKFKAKDGTTKFANFVLHKGAQAKPFMRPAYDSKSEEAILAVTKRIRQRLTKQGITVPAPEDND